MRLPQISVNAAYEPQCPGNTWPLSKSRVWTKKKSKLQVITPFSSLFISVSLVTWSWFVWFWLTFREIANPFIAFFLIATRQQSSCQQFYKETIKCFESSQIKYASTWLQITSNYTGGILRLLFSIIIRKICNVWFLWDTLQNVRKD